MSSQVGQCDTSYDRGRKIVYLFLVEAGSNAQLVQPTPCLALKLFPEYIRMADTGTKLTREV